jgi:hemerythrin-like domain-containing protein
VKRAAELRKLSEDHHHGLVQARRLKEAAASGGVGQAEETTRIFLDFWKDASIHFREEEEVLLPVLARYGGDVSWGPVVEMLAHHARIRGFVMELSDEFMNGNIRSETLRNIGELLETHIRLEEREVFPMIEEVLKGEALRKVASRLAVAEAGTGTEPWVPTEGLSYGP